MKQLIFNLLAEYGLNLEDLFFNKITKGSRKIKDSENQYKTASVEFQINYLKEETEVILNSPYDLADLLIFHELTDELIKLIKEHSETKITNFGGHNSWYRWMEDDIEINIKDDLTGFDARITFKFFPENKTNY